MKQGECMKVYRTGIIGTGFIGKVHLENVRRLGNVEVIAVADMVSGEETAKQMNVPHWYADYKELISITGMYEEQGMSREDAQTEAFYERLGVNEERKKNGE